MTGQFPQLNFSKIETNFDQTLNTAKIGEREREREKERERERRMRFRRIT